MPDVSSEQLREAERVLSGIPEYAWIAGSGQQWYTVSEVADQIAVGKSVIRDWCERGLIVNATLYGQQIGWRMPRSGLLLFFAEVVRDGGRLPADGTNG